MLQTLLGLMLFIMPFLLSTKEISRPGLHIGLWVSLFHWGRLHAAFSILIFAVSLIYYIVQEREKKPKAASCNPRLWISHPGVRPLLGFLAMLIIFCAFGNACHDFGIILKLNPFIQESALYMGFIGSLAGPVIFGLLHDKNGPFPAFMPLLCLGFTGVAMVAQACNVPFLFPLGSLFIHACISGAFTLMPLLVLQFYGRSQLARILPLLLLFLTGLQSGAVRFYNGTDALPQDYLFFMVFLLMMAGPLVFKTWKSRLTVLQ